MKVSKNLKRILAMFVTVLVVVTSIQLPVFADTVDDTTEQAIENVVEEQASTPEEIVPTENVEEDSQQNLEEVQMVTSVSPQAEVANENEELAGVLLATAPEDFEIKNGDKPKHRTWWNLFDDDIVLGDGKHKVLFINKVNGQETTLNIAKDEFKYIVVPVAGPDINDFDIDDGTYDVKICKDGTNYSDIVKTIRVRHYYTLSTSVKNDDTGKCKITLTDQYGEPVEKIYTDEVFIDSDVVNVDINASVLKGFKYSGQDNSGRYTISNDDPANPKDESISIKKSEIINHFTYTLTCTRQYYNLSVNVSGADSSNVWVIEKGKTLTDKFDKTITGNKVTGDKLAVLHIKDVTGTQGYTVTVNGSDVTKNVKNGLYTLNTFRSGSNYYAISEDKNIVVTYKGIEQKLNLKFEGKPQSKGGLSVKIENQKETKYTEDKNGIPVYENLDTTLIVEDVPGYLYTLKVNGEPQTKTVDDEYNLGKLTSETNVTLTYTQQVFLPVIDEKDGTVELLAGGVIKVVPEDGKYVEDISYIEQGSIEEPESLGISYSCEKGLFDIITKYGIAQAVLPTLDDSKVYNVYVSIKDIVNIKGKEEDRTYNFSYGQTTPSDEKVFAAITENVVSLKDYSLDYSDFDIEYYCGGIELFEAHNNFEALDYDRKSSLLPDPTQHNFGETNGEREDKKTVDGTWEEIKLSFTPDSENSPYTSFEIVTTVLLGDYRTPTEIVVPEKALTFYYGQTKDGTITDTTTYAEYIKALVFNNISVIEAANEELELKEEKKVELKEASLPVPVAFDIDDIEVTPETLNASNENQTLIVKYLGDDEHKSAENTVTVHVNKAKSSIKVNSGIIPFSGREINDTELFTVNPSNDVKHVSAIVGIDGDLKGYVNINIVKDELYFDIGDGQANRILELFGVDTTQITKVEEFLGKLGLDSKTENLSAKVLVGILNGILKGAGINDFEFYAEGSKVYYGDVLTGILNKLLNPKMTQDEVDKLIGILDGISKYIPEFENYSKLIKEVLNSLVGFDRKVTLTFNQNPKNAGTYLVVAATVDKNYSYDLGLGTVLITPVTNVDITWNDGQSGFANYTTAEIDNDEWYKATAQATYTKDGQEIIEPLDDSLVHYMFSGIAADGSIGIAKSTPPTEAGVYLETVYVYGNFLKEKTRVVTVKRSKAHIKLEDKEMTYGDYAPDDDFFKAPVFNENDEQIIGKDGEPVYAKIKYIDINLFDKDYYSEVPPTNVGTYWMVAYFEGNTKYDPAVEVRKSLTINQRPIQIIVDDQTQVYGEEEKELTFTTVNPFYPEDPNNGLAKWGKKNEELWDTNDDLGVELVRVPNTKDAGISVIQPSLKTLVTFNDNYKLEGKIKDITKLFGIYTIKQRELEIAFVYPDLTDNGYETTYLDKPAPVEAEYINKNYPLPGDDVEINYWYIGKETATGKVYFSEKVPSKAGKYVVKAYLSGEDAKNYDYVGKTTDYIVNPRAINSKEITAKLDDYLIYNGKFQTQKVKYVKDAKAPGKYLTSKDYDVSFDRYREAGKYSLLIEGKGNYTGKLFIPYEIHAKKMFLSFDKWAYVSTYGEKAPKVKVDMFGNVKGDKLKVELTYSGKSFNGKVYKNSKEAPEEAGNYKVTAKLKDWGDADNYICEKITTTYTVMQQNLEKKANIKLKGQLTYNGKEQTQNFEVYVGKTKLKEGKDFVVLKNKHWSDSDTAKDAGKYTLKIMGIGNYAGTVSKEFTVNPKEITVEFKHTPYVSVYMEEYEDVETKIKGLCGKDKLELVYTYVSRKTGETAKRPVNAGKYTVKAAIKEKGPNAKNYVIINKKGKPVEFVSTSYTIEPRTVKDADIELLGTALVSGQTEQPFEASVNFGLKDLPKRLRHHVLDQADEIEVVYDRAVDEPGVYTLTIIGKGNFTGKASVPFVVLANNDVEAENNGLINGDGTLKYGKGTIDVYATSKNEGMPFFKAEMDKSAVVANTLLTAQELSELVGKGKPHELNLFFVISKPAAPEAEKVVLNQKIGNEFTIDYFKKYDHKKATRLHNSGADVTFTISLTEGMRNTDPKFRRDYTLITNHFGDFSRKDFTYDATENTITFAEHQFSQFLVGYVDVPIAVPTGDTTNVTLYLILAIMAVLLAGGAVLLLCKRKKR